MNENDKQTINNVLGKILNIIKKTTIIGLILLTIASVIFYNINSEMTLGIVMIVLVITLPSLTTLGILTIFIWIIYKITEG